MKKIYLLIISLLFLPSFAYAVNVNNELLLKAYLSTGADIVLTNDVMVTSNLPVNASSSIDLNGHTIDMGTNTLVTYEPLIVKDESDSGIGKITGTGTFVIQVGSSSSPGTFILDSGTIDCRGSYCINNIGNMTINGGSILGSTYVIITRKSLVMNGGHVYSNDDIAIGMTNGGTFVFNDGLISTDGDEFAVYVSANGGTFTMNGGSIEALYEDVDDYKTGGVGLFVGSNTNSIINGGTITAEAFAIAGNGSNNNSNITINGGDITSIHGLGIYFPPVNSKLKITGGEISGLTGVEIRAGSLEVTGGTINATSSTYSIGRNDSGSTSLGVGVAVTQHNTKSDIDVHICNGTINGLVPFAQANTQQNSIDNLSKINILIDNSCGKPIFNSSNRETTVYSQNFDGFIQGGEFTTDVGKYIAPKYGEVLENGMQVVYLYNNITVDDDDIEVVESELRNNVVTVITPDKPGYVVDKIIVTDENGNVIPVRNNKFIMPASDVHIKVLYIPEGEVKGDDIINPVARDLIRCYIHILFTAIIGISLVVINKKLLID